MKKLPIKSTHFQYIEKSFKEWLQTLGYNYQTVYQLPNYVRELLYWLENEEEKKELEEISTPLITQYYHHLKARKNLTQQGGLSNNYLNKHLQGLYKFMEYLRKSGKLQLPYLNISREENNTKNIEIVTIEEIKNLYEICGDHPQNAKWEAIGMRDKAMLAIFYSCGLRRNEGTNLDLVDINFDRQIVHVRHGKGYKERFIPFSKTTLQVLENYIYNYRPYFKRSEEDNALFLSMKGKRMHSQSLSIRLKLLVQKSNEIALQQKDITLHTLRHSIATHLLKAGMPLKQISKFLGHSSLESTQIYTHLATPGDE